MSIGPDSDVLAIAPAAPPVVPPASGGVGALFATRLEDFNPLQYLPVVGTIYRAVTGEHLDPAWRLGGAVVTGALMGGPFGVVTSLFSVGLEQLYHDITDAPAATASAAGSATPDPATPGPAPPDPAVRQQGMAAYAAACTATMCFDGSGARGGMG